MDSRLHIHSNCLTLPKHAMSIGCLLCMVSAMCSAHKARMSQAVRLTHRRMQPLHFRMDTARDHLELSFEAVEFEILSLWDCAGIYPGRWVLPLDAARQRAAFADGLPDPAAAPAGGRSPHAAGPAPGPGRRRAAAAAPLANGASCQVRCTVSRTL